MCHQGPPMAGRCPAAGWVSGCRGTHLHVGEDEEDATHRQHGHGREEQHRRLWGHRGQRGQRLPKRSPPELGTPWPQGLTWGGEGDEQGPTSVEGAKGDSGDTWGQDPGNYPSPVGARPPQYAPISQQPPAQAPSPGCPCPPGAGLTWR